MRVQKDLRHPRREQRVHRRVGHLASIDWFWISRITVHVRSHGMARDDLVRADYVEMTQVWARLARESEESRVSQPAAAERAQVLDAARRADDSFDRDVGQCVAVAHAEVRQRGRDERQARRAAW